MTIRSLKNGSITSLAGGNASVAVPDTPTVTGSTPAGGVAEVSVAFTESGIGAAATSFTVVSSPDSITASGATSPINVTGLTGNTTYTFQVRGVNANGNGKLSSAGTSVVTANPYTLSETFTSSGTYTVPAGKTQVLVVLVGGGATSNNSVGGSGSKIVGFHDYSVSAGQTYAINVASASGTSNFGNLATASITTGSGPANFTSANGGTGGSKPGEGSNGTGGNAAATVSFNSSNVLVTTFQGGGGGGGGGGTSVQRGQNNGYVPNGGAGGSLGGGAGGNSGKNVVGQAGTAGTANTGGGGGTGGGGSDHGDYGNAQGSAGAGGSGKVTVYAR